MIIEKNFDMKIKIDTDIVSKYLNELPNILDSAKEVDDLIEKLNKLKEEYGNLEVELITQRDAWSDEDYNIDDVYIMVTKDKRSMIVIEGEDKTGYRE